MRAASGRRIAYAFAERLGVEASRDAIAKTPIQCILAAQDELRTDLFAHPDPQSWSDEVVTTMLPWQPVVDGQILPSRPIDLIAAGASAGVDIIAGTNLDENRLFLSIGGAIDQVTPEVVAASAAAYGLPVESAVGAYRDRYPDATSGDLLAKLQTDWYWRIPAIRLAEAHAKGPAETYMYEFAWPSPAYDGRLGACHALDIPFVFDTLDKGPDQMVGPLLGEEPPQTLADRMHEAWIAFATCADPGWPQYDLNRRATMRFDVESFVVIDPRGWERALWEGVR
jgi:carboxylesterase type B